MRVVINVVLFQAGWLGCVLFAASGRPWLAVLAVMPSVVVHLAGAGRRGAELALIAAAVTLGVVFDSLLAASGWLVYASPLPALALAPAWIIALWACFATTFNVSLRWLRDRPWLAALLGAAGGPLSYHGGAALGGVALVETLPASLVLAAGWALAMPLLLRLARILDGMQPASADVLRTGLRHG